ncbi:MAG: DNA repair protein RecO [Chloroflexota bacterium]|jgi:DNA repair protein RecO (recombination protein O)
MPRVRTFRSEAIVLRRVDFGEADRMLTLYSRDFGKIKALAKGARKPQARKAGHIELFMRSDFMFAQGKSIDIITQAELIEAYTPLRDDLVRTTYAAYAAELIDGLTPEGDRDVGKYELLSNALGWLAEANDVLLAARYYELRLLSLAGFQPQLFHCLSCREPIEQQDQFFSAELGGLLCPACQDADRGARPISASAVKILRHLQTHQWSYVSGLRLRGKVRRELETVMHFYLRHILERNLRSADFLYRLRREAELFIKPVEE